MYNVCLFVQVLIKDWVMFAIVGVVVGVEVIILTVGTAIPHVQPSGNITQDQEHPHSVNVREHLFTLSLMFTLVHLCSLTSITCPLYVCLCVLYVFVCSLCMFVC